VLKLVVIFGFQNLLEIHSISREHINLAKSICRKCTHQFECAEWGIHNERFGIWGGHTSRDLISIRRKKEYSSTKGGA
jgi:hypothetical protein